MRTNLKRAFDFLQLAGLCLLTTTAAVFVPAVGVAALVLFAGGSGLMVTLAYHAVALSGGVAMGVSAWMWWRDFTTGDGFWTTSAVYRMSRWHTAEAAAPAAALVVVAACVHGMAFAFPLIKI